MTSMPGSWEGGDDEQHPASSSGPPHPLEHQDAHSYAARRMLSRRPEYLSPRQLGIKVGSWNIGNFLCSQDIPEWLTKNGDGTADIYVLGLQEIVDITQTSSFLRYTNPAIPLTWKAHVQAALPPGYECVASPQLIGLLLLVYVSSEIAPLVSSVSTATVGTGLIGYGGNKGACGVRLVLGETLRLSIVDCHLAASTNAVDRRNWDAGQISSRMVFEAPGKDVVGLAPDDEVKAPVAEGLDKADVVLWCGDLNYRIDLDSADVRALLEPYMPKDLPPTHADMSLSPSLALGPAGKWPAPQKLGRKPTVLLKDSPTLQGTLHSLLKHDQLHKQRREGKAFVGYKEGGMTFLPTYKYDVGTVGVWDSSGKARAPSWCDRILWRVKEPPKVEQEEPEEKRERGYTISEDIISAATNEEILFETVYDDDSDEEDLVVSRAESPIPHQETQKEVPPIFDEPTSTVQTPFGEIRLEQKVYTSHQNVSSSDHKPVSSTFLLTFPAVDPERRAKVHAEVAREVDKLENERRPVITTIIDQPDEVGLSDDVEGVVNLGEVRFWEKKHRTLTVANTGTLKAKIHFVGRPLPDGSGKEVICKPWVKVEFLDHDSAVKDTRQTPELEPGEVISISLTLLIDQVQQVLALNDGSETLDDVLVLRVEGGRDEFIPISATWLYSSYGTTLKELVRIPEGAGGFRGYRKHKEVLKEGPLYSAPREIYRITQFICDSVADVVTLGPDERIGYKRWFTHPGWPVRADTWGHTKDAERRRAVEVGVWEALDTDREFDDEKCIRVAMNPDDPEVSPEEHVEAAVAVFLRWLGGLGDGVIPSTFWTEIVAAGGDSKAAEAVLDHLPEKGGQIHAIVFVNLMGFIQELLEILVNQEGDKKQMAAMLERILDPLAAVLIRRPQGLATKIPYKEEAAKRAWMKRFVEP